MDPSGYSWSRDSWSPRTASRTAATVSPSATTNRDPESAIILASSPACDVGLTGTATAWARSTAR